MMLENERTFDFLQGLNHDLDEVRREESRRRVMLHPPRQETSSLDTQGSALLAHKPDGNRINRDRYPTPNKSEVAHGYQSDGRVVCDFCKRSNHTRDTCWEIHGKPTDWKPRKQQSRPKSAHIAESTSSGATGPEFSSEDLDMLRQLLQQTRTSMGSVTENSKTPIAAVAKTGQFFGEDDWSC